MTEKFFIPRPEPIGYVDYAFESKTERLPAYRTAEGETLIWSTRDGMPLPAVGDTVTITMNAIGPARVEGYFASEGFLGVMTTALAPPEWLRKQNRDDADRTDRPDWYRRGIGCEFGTEIAPYRRGDRTRHAAALKARRDAAKARKLAMMEGRL